MKITIEAEPKEIVDLIVALQGQQISKTVLKMVTSKTVSSKDLKKCIGNELSRAFDTSNLNKEG